MLGLLDKRDVRATHRMADMGSWGGDAAGSFTTRGLPAGTQVATTFGWRSVEAVAVGDEILTFDNGLRPVVAITRTPIASQLSRQPVFARPVHVPAGALGNDVATILLADEPVMIESDAAEALSGDPFAILRARDLVGLRGIHHVGAIAAEEAVTLHFADAQVIVIQGDALVVADEVAPDSVTRLLSAATGLPAPYTTYRGETARHLVAAIAAEDARQVEGGKPAA